MGLVDGLKNEVRAARKRENALSLSTSAMGMFGIGIPAFAIAEASASVSFGKVCDFIDKSPVEGFLCREPAAYFHQGEKVFRLALAARGVELGAVKVELVEVGLDFLAVGDERSELVAVEAAPLEEGHRAFMHEVHCPSIDGDTGRAERSDGCGGSIEAHEMHIDIAVIERPVASEPPRLSIRTLTCFPSFFASSRSTVERSKS